MDKNYKQYLPKINFTLEVLLKGLRNTNLRIDNISGGGGGSQDLQSVLDIGGSTTDKIIYMTNNKYGANTTIEIGGSLLESKNETGEILMQIESLGSGSRMFQFDNFGGVGPRRGTEVSGSYFRFISGAIGEEKIGGMVADSIQNNPQWNFPDKSGIVSLLEDILNPTLDTYATNAAAIFGGLPVGRIYKTVTGEIRIVV